MPDLYAREVARYSRERCRFALVEVDVYQRGVNAEAEDICHLRAVRVIVPSGAPRDVVDALIAAALLQLQYQASGEATEIASEETRHLSAPARGRQAIEALVTPERIAEAAAHYQLTSELRALEQRAVKAERQIAALRLPTQELVAAVPVGREE